MLRGRHLLGRTHRTMAPAAARILEGSFGLIETMALGAAAELGVADALAAGPLTTDVLATRIGADPDALARLLRLLVSIGYFARSDRGRSLAEQRDVRAAAGGPPGLDAGVGAAPRERLDRHDLERAPDIHSHRRVGYRSRIRGRVLRLDATAARDRRGLRSPGGDRRGTGGRSRRAASPIDARSSAATSSHRCPEGAISTCCSRSCTTGTTSPRSGSSPEFAKR